VEEKQKKCDRCEKVGEDVRTVPDRYLQEIFGKYTDIDLCPDCESEIIMRLCDRIYEE